MTCLRSWAGDKVLLRSPTVPSREILNISNVYKRRAQKDILSAESEVKKEVEDNVNHRNEKIISKHRGEREDLQLCVSEMSKGGMYGKFGFYQLRGGVAGINQQLQQHRTNTLYVLMHCMCLTYRIQICGTTRTWGQQENGEETEAYQEVFESVEKIKLITMANQCDCKV